MNINLHVMIPGVRGEKSQIMRELLRNAESGQGVVVTMPDGYTFDLILDEVTLP